MKQILEERKELSKKKGTVLLTVVGVMMVLVVFLLSTLVLTASSNRRSYYTYYETQAQYAAQAALDSVTNSAYSNKNFYDWVSQKVGLGDPAKPITVEFDANSGIQFTNDSNVVNCTIERVPDNYVWDEDTKAIHSQRAWKITATASVGNGRNQADYTVCNYIYETYRAPEDGLNSGVQNEAQSTVYTGTTEEEESNFIAIGTMQFGRAATSNNMIYYGPQITATNKLPLGRGNYDGNEQSLDNNNGAIGNILMTQGYKSNVEVSNEFQRKGECAIYYGNIVGGNSGFSAWYANITDAYKPIGYNDLNYVYVDGRMEPGNTNLIVGRRNNGSDVGDPGNYPVNLFVGSIKTSSTDKTVAVYGDAYLLDPDEDSYWDGSANKSALAQFVENNVNGANVDGDLNAAVGGNIYCINRSLSIGMGGQKMVIDGNLVFANKSGTLTVGNNIEVKGKIICSGTYVGSLPAITGDAVNAYIDTAYAYYNSNYSSDVPSRVETVEWDERIDTGELEYVGQEWGPDLENIWNGPNGPGWYRRIYRIEHHVEEQTITNDYSLYPFAYRPDEIFEVYYRWDLKQPVTVGAAETTRLAKTDPLVLESIACGHNWESTELMQDVSGAQYYVPFTTPVDSSHSFIKKYVVSSPATSVAQLQEAGYAVYDTGEAFKAAMGTAASTTVNATSAGSKNVKICYHDDQGNATSKEITDATLVSQSCVLNINGGAKVVIDPSQRSNKNVPLYIYLTGGSDAGADIIINNTASYLVDEDNPTPYYNDTNGTQSYLPKHGEVVIFLDKSVKLEKTCIATTGLYGHMDGSVGDNKSGTVYVVQNPVYPGDPNFGRQNAETDYGDAFKFAYELVPNAIILADKTRDGGYGGSNGFFWNAELIMPEASIYNGTPNFVNLRPYYREEWDSYTKVPRASTYLVGMGGSMTDEVGANDQWATIAYIGDSHRKQQTTIDYGNNSSDLGADNKDYLHNNYQGAN